MTRTIGTPRARAHRSRKLRECEHCRKQDRGLIGGPRGGWIHPECLRKLAKK